MKRELDWPSAVRAGAIEDEAEQIRQRDGDETAEAFRLARYVLEWEISDGRGGGELAAAAEAFVDALSRG